MANVKISFRGTSPLLCHSDQLVDPDNEFVKQIKILTSKRTKTEEDRRAVEKLEWYGGLYVADGIEGPVVPTANLKKSLIDGAKMTRKGRDVERAIIFTDMHVPIAYNGPRNLDELFRDKTHHNRASVRVSTSRVMRVRPSFPEWVVTATAFFVEAAMDFDDLRRIVELAGIVEGLGDNRKNGFGRYVGEVTRA